MQARNGRLMRVAGKRPFVGRLVQELLGMVATGNGRLVRVARYGRLWAAWSAAAGHGAHRQLPFDGVAGKRPFVGQLWGSSWARPSVLM